MIQFHANAKEPYCKFSNFMHVNEGIRFNGVIYPSTEHAYQAQKYKVQDRFRFSIDGDLGVWNGFALISSKSPVRWKRKNMIGIIAKMATNKKRENQLKLTRIDFQTSPILWTKILSQKFQISTYKQLLLQTKSSYLLEFDRFAAKHGSFWGGLLKNDTIYGQNNMGKLLMYIRDEVFCYVEKPRKDGKIWEEF